LEDEKYIRATTKLTFFHSIRIRIFFARRSFANWNENNLYDGYKIEGGARCAGHYEENEEGRRVDKMRRGVVKLICGEYNMVVGVEEDAICEYSVEFMTPLACGGDVIEGIVRELEEIGEGAGERGVGGEERIGLIEDGLMIIAKAKK